MRRLLLIGLAALGLLACSGSSTCTNSARVACDLDGGSGCGTHQSCINAAASIDPCPAGASGCCFQVCATDKECPSNQLCTAGVCAEGRCATAQ